MGSHCHYVKSVITKNLRETIHNESSCDNLSVSLFDFSIQCAIYSETIPSVLDILLVSETAFFDPFLDNLPKIQ